jgi:hypothetical protein
MTIKPGSESFSPSPQAADKLMIENMSKNLIDTDECSRIDPLGGDVILRNGVSAIAGTVRVGEGCVGVVFGEICKVGPRFFVLIQRSIVRLRAGWLNIRATDE